MAHCAVTRVLRFPGPTGDTDKLPLGLGTVARALGCLDLAVRAAVQFYHWVAWAGLCALCFSVGGSWLGVVVLVLALQLINALLGAVGGRPSATFLQLVCHWVSWMDLRALCV